MKKLTLFITLIMCFTFFGCKSNQEENITGGWNLQTNYIKTNIPEDAKKVFDNALEKYNGSSIEPVALLGTQVVAGTNYMFFCKETKENTASWKIIIIYKDLNGNSNITKIKDFDFSKYLNDDEINNENLAGGWNTYIDNYQDAVAEDIQEIFNNSTKDSDIEYKTLALLGTQVVAGTNYSILVVGFNKISEKANIYVLTIYNDLQNISKIIAKNYINLADFNA